ncbi:acetate/propionate family kinase [Sessilibacter sp. MAH2]
MSNVLLTLNAGSSNLKFSVYELPDLIPAEHGKIEFDREHHNPLEKSLEDLITHIEENHGHRTIKMIGHRLVHGGEEFVQPIRLDEAITDKLHELIPLAPLHLPAELSAVEFIAGHYSDIPQVACFDTAFHATQSPLYKLFALPRSLAREGVLRYGFHGLSYHYISTVIEQHVLAEHREKLVVAHLGNGASMCAMKGGKSVTTTMGFTALDGLMMGTRCGELDAGVVLYLAQAKQLDISQIETLLYKQSGLLGVSEISSDVRELEASNDERAKEALDLFCFRAAQKLAGLIPALNGIDGIIFTGGIGENSALVRAKIIESLQWLGATIDTDKNQLNQTQIHAASSQLGIYVIPTNEEWMLAKQTLTTIGEQF